MTSRDEMDIETRFNYHPPFGDQSERYDTLRKRFRDLAYDIVHMAPESRERSLAFTSLEQASMWANAAIARREPREPS